jgi:hypothetical protein
MCFVLLKCSGMENSSFTDYSGDKYDARCSRPSRIPLSEDVHPTGFYQNFRNLEK